MARIKLKDRTLENDIKYGGVLSYRHLRIIAWVCLAIAQISVVLSLQAKLNKDSASTVDLISTILSYVGSLPLPLFFLANVSEMTRKKSNFRSFFYKYGGLAIGMFLLQNLLVMHFIYGIAKSLEPSLTLGQLFRSVGEILPSLGYKAYMLNIFIDMFLCTLLFFFLYYDPQRVFTGKKKIIFRLFSLLPIAYEIGAIFVKYYVMLGRFSMPSYYFFLLPSKPPLVFLAFVALIVFLKIYEVRHLRKPGNNMDTWYEHTKTKAHSLKVSIITAISFLIAALLDLAIVIAFIIVNVAGVADLVANEDELLLYVFAKLSVLTNAGMGGAVPLIMIIPIVLLFSYTKTHKNKNFDVIIPALGIALMAAVYFEGFFLVITKNLEKIMTVIENETGDEATFLSGKFVAKDIFYYVKTIPNKLLFGI